jgi:hypothetical protein
MRYEKKVVVLSSVFAALLVIWALGLVFSPDRAQARSESGRLLPGKAAEVAAILIQESGSGPIELVKSGSSWVLSDGSAKFPVQTAHLSSFLDDVAAVSRLRPIAWSRGSWSNLELGDAQAKRATLKDAKGKVLADFYVGGYGPTGSEVYIRRSGSDASYSAETGIASYFTGGRSGWLDLKVMGDLRESDVQSFSVKSDIALDAKAKAHTKLDYELRRDGKGWKIANGVGAASVVGAAGHAGDTLDAEAASALLRTIVGLQGEDYVSAPPADAFSPILARVDLELGTGKAKVLEVGSKASGAAGSDARFYARLADGPVFLLSSYSLSSILKSPGDLAATK